MPRRKKGALPKPRGRPALGAKRTIQRTVMMPPALDAKVWSMAKQSGATYSRTVVLLLNNSALLEGKAI